MWKLIANNSNSVKSALGLRSISASSKTSGIFGKSEDKEVATSPVEIFDIIEDEVDEKQQQAKIKRITNKSRLYAAHRNIINGELPYPGGAESWVHNTLKYSRKMYGKYGSKSNIDPRICFWTESELKEKKEYERVAFPLTVPEMMAINEQQKKYKSERIIAREAEIVKNLEKLEQWKRDIQMRKEKKETEARLGKERKDRLIEEVRRHFGYKLDPRDDRFKEMLELKEKEQRKAMKETKRLAKETKMMAKLIDTQKSGKKKNEDAESNEDKDSEKDDEEPVKK